MARRADEATVRCLRNALGHLPEWGAGGVPQSLSCKGARVAHGIVSPARGWTHNTGRQGPKSGRNQGQGPRAQAGRDRGWNLEAEVV